MPPLLIQATVAGFRHARRHQANNSDIELYLRVWKPESSLFADVMK